VQQTPWTARCQLSDTSGDHPRYRPIVETRSPPLTTTMLSVAGARQCAVAQLTATRSLYVLSGDGTDLLGAAVLEYPEPGPVPPPPLTKLQDPTRRMDLHHAD
jgi:hypothetical protein